MSLIHLIKIILRVAYVTFEKEKDKESVLFFHEASFKNKLARIIGLEFFFA